MAVTFCPCVHSLRRALPDGQFSRLILRHPFQHAFPAGIAPKVLNNVGFAYLTVACIDTTALATHLPQFFITFIVGSVLFNGVCVLLMKPAKALAVKSVQKENV